jgi:MFS family permease
VKGRAAIRRLAVAQFLSTAGSEMAAIALSVDVYRRTGSAVWLGATFFLTFGITGLLSPVAGLIADRFDRQRVMVVSDVAGAVVWTFLLLGQSPAWLLIFGFIATAVAMPFGIASGAAVPNLVGEENLAWANGTVATAANLSRLLGPVIGGAVAGVFGPRDAYLANAVSFVLSAALIASITARFQAGGDENEERGNIWTGFAVIFRDPVLRSLTILWTVLALTINVVAVADLPLSRAFGWGAFGFGLMNAFFGGGALIGAFFARKVTVRTEASGVLIEVVGIALGYGLVAVAPAFSLVLAGQSFAAGTDAFGEVAGTNIVQRATLDASRGRVFGAISASLLTANAIGFMFVGFVVQAIGPRWTYGACAFISLAVAPLVAPLFTARRQGTPME